MKKKLSWVCVFLIVFSLFGCKSNDIGGSSGDKSIPTPENYDEIQIKLEEGIVYNVIDNFDIKLDIAYPEDTSVKHPCIIFIIGGGFSSCSRISFRYRIEEAAKKGYAAISMDYRTAPKYLFPEPVKDVQAVLQWISQNSHVYGIEKQKLAIVGHSAGAYLALMTVMLPDLPEYKFNSTREAGMIKAVVNIASPADFAEMGENLLHEAFLGGKLSEIRGKYELASVISHVGGNYPPILTIHGEADDVIPIEQSILFDVKMREAGAVHTLIRKEFEGHMTWDDEVWTFLHQYLN